MQGGFMRMLSSKKNNSLVNKVTLGDLQNHFQNLLSKWKRLNDGCWNWQLLEEFKKEVRELADISSALMMKDIHNLAHKLMHQLTYIDNKKKINIGDHTNTKHLLIMLKKQIAEIKEDNVTSFPKVPTLNTTIKIALLESNQSAESTVEYYLSQQGYQIVTYNDPTLFKNDILQEGFDIALIDLNQSDPSLSNLHSIESLVSNDTKKTPIIVLADNIDLSTRLTALRAGVKAYITKPIDNTELIYKIESILSSRNSQQIKVLMVDDDSTITELYQSTLTDAGFQVRCINQPLDILQHIESFQPDVITLDQSMPECSGLEIAEILRGDAHYMRIPIVFISSMQEEIEKKEVLGIFCDALLEKPVDTKQLCQLLNQIAIKSQKAVLAEDTQKVVEPLQFLHEKDTEKTATQHKLPNGKSSAHKKIIKALENRSFQLAFQSIIKPDSDNHLFEVLVRLVDEDGTTYLPKDFLSLINDYLEDGYYSLDRWIIEHAFKSLESATGRGSEEFSIVIKLYPDLKQIERLLPFIYNLMSNTHLRGNHRVYFSIPAQTMLTNPALAKRIENAFHAADYGLIIDHWTGTDEELKAITQFEHIDFVKLAPSFRSKFSTASKIKQSIKTLTMALRGKTETIASVVEDAQSFAFFWGMNIRYFQGFFIHKPNNMMHYNSAEEEHLVLKK